MGGGGLAPTRTAPHVLATRRVVYLLCSRRRDFLVYSENLIKTMADHMAADGYKDAGYEYIIIDDCWPAHERTKDGQLQPDPDRFPSGIKALADYVSICNGV